MNIVFFCSSYGEHLLRLARLTSVFFVTGSDTLSMVGRLWLVLSILTIKCFWGNKIAITNPWFNILLCIGLYCVHVLAGTPTSAWAQLWAGSLVVSYGYDGSTRIITMRWKRSIEVLFNPIFGLIWHSPKPNIGVIDRKKGIYLGGISSE